MVLFIDHYDSFTNTIVDYITYLGHKVLIVKTDDNTPKLNNFSHIVIGPGPGHPDELTKQYQVIKYCEQNNIPLLGICLGHQLIAQYYGSKIIKAKQVYHGKNSVIRQINHSPIYFNHPESFEVTRYHSLIVDEVKKPLITTAITRDDEIMAFQHKSLKIFGVQYHPEAYLTEYGLNTLGNFLKL
ncbi:aminodeoxychorismate/anthranilate synthase component II [Allofrancisella guangzhouensis]|uniref:Anthranilate synthase subunit II n=1 Tax=Allofrancisella guangzhouensis TaxID=594679 RepID=A0A0A8E5Q8_9GAMM|nr:aminodeoxychorismate/anthranilate synthase component II [Allofrancisella guangzhouensis]AJC48932.1 anthranilate synthase subunit II [Allofrancisella guangzhouensis]MBK2027103.1 aminodeoxychorismate/anthranilate synthase component II [Allofrancisella guangzhouensis]MBK2044097.1 aminodeoxychorismate/anthranilate synthase component II [Allofrancisella guangzhouensis]MBK2045659.1 aminodeoxychorismate/anthranilate synthase component II [Allofrancisella guangzhouensis]